MPQGYGRPLAANQSTLIAGLLATAVMMLAVSGLRAERKWVDNQAARLAIGQPFFTRQAPLSSRETIGGVGGVAYGGDILLIADGNRVGSLPLNNRVLIYRNVGSFVPKPDDELPQGTVCPACVGLPDVVLGQPDFDTFTPNVENGMQNPTGVATDGVRIAVADTDNNRVLIWHSIPTANGAAPDVVIGQADAINNAPGTSATEMRGPQGVWFDGGKFFVADTQNSRILIYNSVPTATGATPDIVLGQPDFDTRPEPDLTQSNVEPTATGMLDPVSVTVSDGKLLVADLGFNRILIFNSIPTSNAMPADVVIGQPDMESNITNNSSELCEPLEIPREEGDEDDPNADLLDTDETFPFRCDRTLSFPRFAISDGEKLYVSDGGNDRILVFNEVPTENAPHPDTIIGQRDFFTLLESDGAASIRAPQALAHDGENLYVADPFTRRVLVFTPGEDQIVQDGLRNSASFLIRATANVMFDLTAADGQELTVTLDGTDYTHAASADQTAWEVRDALLDQIVNDPEAVAFAIPKTGEGDHAAGSITFGGAVREGEVVILLIGEQTYQAEVLAGDAPTSLVDRFNFFAQDDPLVATDRDPNNADRLRITAREVGAVGNGIPYSVHTEEGSEITLAAAGDALRGGVHEQFILLSAQQEGPAGNNIRLSVRKSVGGGINLVTSGGRLTGGSDARELPAGAQGTIFGTDFSDAVYSAKIESGSLPTELGGVRVYANGILTPLTLVSPTQINFQLPWQTAGTTVSVYVRRRMPDGTVQVSASRAADVTRASPGLYAFAGEEPRRAVALHGQGKATGTIAITANEPDSNQPVSEGINLTISVGGRPYTITTTQAESAVGIRDRLVQAINAGEGDPDVIAAAGQVGFFSARVTVTFKGEVRVGDVFTIFVNGRIYGVVVQEDDTLVSVRNKLVFEVNSGLGDPEVTARRFDNVGDPELQIIARELGEGGNNIFFDITVSPGESPTMIETDLEEDSTTLRGGRTPPVVFLTAREAGREGNEINFGAESSDTIAVRLTAAGTNLCCGNEEFSLITQENPAIPGEVILVYGTGLGLTAPLPQDEGLEAGMVTPGEQLFNVPFNADDFVSSVAGGKTAQVRFAGLAPLLIGVYQINLKILEDLPDDPALSLTIAQQRFISNPVTIPVKNLTPRTERTE